VSQCQSLISTFFQNPAFGLPQIRLLTEIFVQKSVEVNNTFEGPWCDHNSCDVRSYEMSGCPRFKKGARIKLNSMHCPGLHVWLLMLLDLQVSILYSNIQVSIINTSHRFQLRVPCINKGSSEWQTKSSVWSIIHSWNQPRTIRYSSRFISNPENFRKRNTLSS